MFNRYKSDECLDKTDVQGDFSLIGSEFINFVATVLTCRMLRKAREAEEKSSGKQTKTTTRMPKENT